jgi:hypothetical protein
MKQLTDIQEKELKILIEFVRLFCHHRHGEQQPVSPEIASICDADTRLCPECHALVSYAADKRAKCPLDPKPTCKNCHVHCYSKEYRAKIRAAMSFSGKRMILRGRLDYLWHYFF